jgi:hypothetical protein
MTMTEYMHALMAAIGGIVLVACARLLRRV